MKLPNFLLDENVKPLDETTEEFSKVLAKYREKFNEGVMTEPSDRSMEEWIELLNTCIEKNQTYWELTGEEFYPDATY